MSQADAYKLLAAEMQPYRDLSFIELREFAGQRSSRRVTGDDANVYLVDVGVEWYSRSQDELIVEGMAALASTGPLRRLDRSFIVSAAGVRAG